MRVVTFIAGLVLAALQYVYWLGPSGHFEVEALAEQTRKHERMNAVLAERNRVLLAEVQAFKDHTLAAVEARARTDLGMVAKNETFYIVDDRPRAR